MVQNTFFLIEHHWLNGAKCSYDERKSLNERTTQIVNVYFVSREREKKEGKTYVISRDDS